MHHELTPLDTRLLRRTLDLAARGGPATRTNPNVGALLAAADGRILGEGWHRVFGGPHAEPEAIAQVTDAAALQTATLYVSLEPCRPFPGKKTPACADRIVAAGIRRVVVGCPDPNPQVGGKGIAHLQAHGVRVLLAADPQPFRDLIRPFRVNQQAQRPYLVLKWASTADGKLGYSDPARRLFVTGGAAARYTHSLRARVQAVVVGWRTALADDPLLTVRHHPSDWQPMRLVLDRHARLASHLARLRLFQAGGNTWWLTAAPQAHPAANVLPAEAWATPEGLVRALYRDFGIGSALVEGGTATLQALLDAGLYDEIHLLQSPDPAPDADVLAPVLPASAVAGLRPVGSVGRDRVLATFADR